MNERAPDSIEFESDDDRLSLAFDALRYAQDQINDGVDELIVTEAMEPWVRSLYELWLDKVISAEGDNMIFPDTESTAEVIGAVSRSGSATGMFTGIKWHRVFEDGEYLQTVLGLQLYIDDKKFETIVQKQRREYFVFAPIESCSFHIFEDMFITPEDDDEIAAEIDETLMNESIDFAELSKVIAERFTDMSEMQQQFYLDHINRMAAFTSITAIAPRELCISGDDEVIVITEPSLIDGAFRGFYIIHADYGEGMKPRLVVCTDGEDGDLAGVFVDEISDLQLK